MGRGIQRLQQGIVRTLTPYEVERGYVFISQDKHLYEILDIKDFEVEIAGEVYPSRRIVRGRVQISNRVLRNIGTAREVRMGLVSRKRLKIEAFSPRSRRQGSNGTVHS